MLHKNIIPADAHAVHSWLVADATALAALTPVAADVGKVALQLSPFDVFILEEEVGPTWVSLVNDTGIAASTVSVVDSGGFYTGTELETILDEIGTALDALDTAVALAEVQCISIAASDEETVLTLGADKVTFHAPYAMTITEVMIGLNIPQVSGTIIGVDAHVNGTTMLSTKVTIDNTEGTSATAATPAVISAPNWAKGDRISVDIDTLGDGTAAGLKIYFIGYRI